MLEVKYLIDRFGDKIHNAEKSITDLLVMEENLGDHFFIDELPTTVLPEDAKKGQQFYGPDLTHLTSKFDVFHHSLLMVYC